MAPSISSVVGSFAIARRGPSAGARFRYAWLIYLLACGSAIVLYGALDIPAVRAVIFLAIDGSAIVAVAFGLWIHRPTYRRTWTLVAVGSVFWMGGDLASGLWPVTIAKPIGGFDDGLALSAYLIISAAMLLLIRSRTPGRDRASLIDASIVASAFGLLVWVTVSKPLIGASSQSLLDELDAAIYPALDVFLLGIAVRLAIGPGRRSVSFWLILGSLVALLVGDVGYAFEETGSVVALPLSLQLAWLASHIFSASAALHPSMRDLATRSQTQGSRPLGWRWALASGAMLFGPGLLGVENALGDPRPDIIPIILAMLVISSLVLARVAGLVGDLRAAVSDRERALMEQRRAERARVDLEERLRQSQKMEAIGQLAGGVAHDLNNLLTVIGGHAELLRTGVELPGHAREDLDGIEDGVRRAVQVTRGLLAFARRSHLSPVVVSPDVVVADVVPLLRRFISEAISLEVELEESLPPILVDRAQVQHVILNLVLNARDAMPSGGRLTIGVSRVDDPELGCAVEISVGDTGVGIAPDRLPHIFEPFYTTKGPDRGTGLGLAIVDGIVAQSGGRTLVTSVPNQGSVFRVRLPAAEGSGVQEAVGPARGLARAQGERILVVEDDAAVRGLLVRWLTHLGYDVSLADGPTRGLEMAQTLPIDLVVSDVVMPGISGPSMVQQLAAERPGLPALFVSGYPEHAIFEQSAGLRPTDRVLQKPFGLEELATAVRSALEG